MQTRISQQFENDKIVFLHEAPLIETDTNFLSLSLE